VTQEAGRVTFYRAKMMRPLNQKTLICTLLASVVVFVAASPAQTGAPTYGYRVVHTYPHDPRAYTQGLIYLDGYLYESTGLEGHSTLRKVNLQTGEVLQRYDLPPDIFAEGLTNWKDTLVQLTWKKGKGFVYDRATFRQLRTFPYTGEGWGLTQDGAHLIESDGSSSLRFWDPRTFQEVKRIVVKDGRVEVHNLNELEYIHGQIYANVWQTDLIAVISPESGQVTRWIDFSGLRPASTQGNPDAVLNGIAFDAAHDRIFVTGKLWPKLFEIQVVPKSK
jgi:glutaminyl-peptide cyclotransferase